MPLCRMTHDEACRCRRAVYVPAWPCTRMMRAFFRRIGSHIPFCGEARAAWWGGSAFFHVQGLQQVRHTVCPACPHTRTRAGVRPPHVHHLQGWRGGGRQQAGGGRHQALVANVLGQARDQQVAPGSAAAQPSHRASRPRRTPSVLFQLCIADWCSVVIAWREERQGAMCLSVAHAPGDELGFQGFSHRGSYVPIYHSTSFVAACCPRPDAAQLAGAQSASPAAVFPKGDERQVECSAHSSDCVIRCALPTYLN